MPRKRPDQPDRRGAKPGGPQSPHERTDASAALVSELVGYGMPLAEVAHACNLAFGGGFSVDTLDRHYREELDAALADRKAKLLRRAHRIAMGEVDAPGVSPDAKFREEASTIKWLLGAVHRVRDGMEHDLGAGTINITISPDDAEL